MRETRLEVVSSNATTVLFHVNVHDGPRSPSYLFLCHFTYGVGKSVVVTKSFQNEPGLIRIEFACLQGGKARVKAGKVEHKVAACESASIR